MDREKLALCDRLWMLTQENRIKWTRVGNASYKAEVDGTNLTLDKEVVEFCGHAYTRNVYFMKIENGERFSTLREGWKGWKRIFELHPIAYMFIFCRDNEHAMQKIQQRTTDSQLITKLSAKLDGL